MQMETMENPRDKDPVQCVCYICEEIVDEDVLRQSPRPQYCSHTICNRCKDDLILRDPETQQPYHPCPLCAETSHNEDPSHHSRSNEVLTKTTEQIQIKL